MQERKMVGVFLITSKGTDTPFNRKQLGAVQSPSEPPCREWQLVLKQVIHTPRTFQGKKRETETERERKGNS